MLPSHVFPDASLPTSEGRIPNIFYYHLKKKLQIVFTLISDHIAKEKLRPENVRLYKFKKFIPLTVRIFDHPSIEHAFSKL